MMFSRNLIVLGLVLGLLSGCLSASSNPPATESAQLPTSPVAAGDDDGTQTVQLLMDALRTGDVATVTDLFAVDHPNRPLTVQQLTRLWAARNEVPNPRDPVKIDVLGAATEREIEPPRVQGKTVIVRVHQHHQYGESLYTFTLRKTATGFAVMDWQEEITRLPDPAQLPTLSPAQEQ